jgi:uncharacterized protein YbjT (DUF2867 family)
MKLVIGATGMLGSEISHWLVGQGHAVRALVRETANPERITQLRSIGADLVRGDLKRPDSLTAACRNVRTVISTASSTLSRQDGDSIETVDRQGQLNLIEAAERAGVEHFVLISFPAMSVDFPLQRAKREVEDRLRRSRMAHTILQPTFFIEVWLSSALGFDPANGRAQIYGEGHNAISWISFQDVAVFAAAAVNNPRAVNATIALGGPEAISPIDVVHSAEQLFGRSIARHHIPERALLAQLEATTDPMQQSFAGLMLSYAHGEVIDMTEATRIFEPHALRSVRDYFRTVLGAATA